jgi:hypothetical protein
MEEAPTTSTDSTPTFSLGIDIGKEALELALLNREGPTAKTSVSNDGEGRKTLRGWLEEWGTVPEKPACAWRPAEDTKRPLPPVFMKRATA